jgi:hypothetical protein
MQRLGRGCHVFQRMINVECSFGRRPVEADAIPNPARAIGHHVDPSRATDAQATRFERPPRGKGVGRFDGGKHVPRYDRGKSAIVPLSRRDCRAQLPLGEHADPHFLPALHRVDAGAIG